MDELTLRDLVRIYGLSDKEIANKFGIKESTVRVYRSRWWIDRRGIKKNLVAGIKQQIEMGKWSADTTLLGLRLSESEIRALQKLRLYCLETGESLESKLLGACGKANSL